MHYSTSEKLWNRLNQQASIWGRVGRMENGRCGFIPLSPSLVPIPLQNSPKSSGDSLLSHVTILIRMTRVYYSSISLLPLFSFFSFCSPLFFFTSYMSIIIYVYSKLLDAALIFHLCEYPDGMEVAHTFDPFFGWLSEDSPIFVDDIDQCICIGMLILTDYHICVDIVKLH